MAMRLTWPAITRALVYRPSSAFGAICPTLGAPGPWSRYLARQWRCFLALTPQNAPPASLLFIPGADLRWRAGIGKPKRCWMRTACPDPICTAVTRLCWAAWASLRTL